MYTITGSIIPLEEYSCGSGLGAVGYADSLVIKTHNGLPFIPANHLKGKIRDAVEDICNFLDIPICDSENTGITFCGLHPINGKDEKYFCPVCQIFGSSLNQGCFNFSPASIYIWHLEFNGKLDISDIDKIKQKIYQVEHSTRIDSDTKTALDKHLRSKESVSTRLPFEFEIRQIRKFTGEEEKVIRILLAGLRFTRFIGSRRTRGRGNIIIDGIELNPKLSNDNSSDNYKKEIEKLFEEVKTD